MTSYRDRDRIDNPYFGMLITCENQENLEAIRAGLREMGIQVATGPFLIDSKHQETMLPLAASLTVEECQRTEDALRQRRNDGSAGLF